MITGIIFAQGHGVEKTASVGRTHEHKCKLDTIVCDDLDEKQRPVCFSVNEIFLERNDGWKKGCAKRLGS